jgi:hypothetical protein
MTTKSFNKQEPADLFADLQQAPEFVSTDFIPDVPDFDDPLTILLRQERTGEFLFNEDASPYNNLF